MEKEILLFRFVIKIVNPNVAKVEGAVPPWRDSIIPIPLKTGSSTFPPGRRPYPPACRPYGLEAGPEANWGEAPKFYYHGVNIK